MLYCIYQAIITYKQYFKGWKMKTSEFLPEVNEKSAELKNTWAWRTEPSANWRPYDAEMIKVRGNIYSNHFFILNFLK